MALISVDGSLSEHLIEMTLGSDAHVLLTKRLDVGVDVSMLLLIKHISFSSRLGTCVDI
jgi:hypothetical protein